MSFGKIDKLDMRSWRSVSLRYLSTVMTYKYLGSFMLRRVICVGRTAIGSGHSQPFKHAVVA